eukprot:PDM62110.1 hypothetical protein PRIPAC_51552 [Pristionchus pacificus]
MRTVSTAKRDFCSSNVSAKRRRRPPPTAASGRTVSDTSDRAACAVRGSAAEITIHKQINTMGEECEWMVSSSHHGPSTDGTTREWMVDGRTKKEENK